MTPIPLLLAVALPGCLPVTGKRITAGDLSAAVASFAALPPDTVLGYAPLAGVRRTFTRAEIARLGAVHKLETEAAGDVCFEWKTRVPQREELEAAMRAALQEPEARIEILETSLAPAPEGEIVFLRQGLPRTPPAGPVTGAVWRGYVRYAGERRFDVWARVRVLIPGTRVTAASLIKTGETVREDQIRVETVEAAGFDPQAVRGAAEIVGQVARRAIQPGMAIPRSYVEPPKAVSKGAPVRVEVRSGTARLRLEGTAEAGGNIGQTIPVRNVQSGKTFPARITAPGAVLVAGRRQEGDTE
ncbi:MAG: flagellar basal body P-ring formation protein FlgA [Acidobacteria bacterium]|nr:flagellar basal body P-ring formation protein FlgA [Acidobacteriota bacterium]